MSEENKKRLRMLPEVLPAPPQAIAAVGPRQRTMDNLRRLAAAAGAAATLSACGQGQDHGYGVVDPMPPPARCSGLGGTVHGTIEWRTPELLLLTLGAPQMEGATYVDSPPTIYGGTLGAVSIQPNAVTIEITPTSDSFSLTVHATCAAGPSDVSMSIARTEIPATGTMAVQLQDVYAY